VSSTLVLDVSGAAEFVMDRARADVVRDGLLSAELVVVPALYRFEATNLLWKYHAFHDVPLPRCQSALESSLRLPDQFIPGDDLHEESFKTACLTEHVSYDIFYLVVAERTNGTLVTLDEDLRELALKQDVNVLPE